MAAVLLDTNLLLVLIVGRTGVSHLASHKRVAGYDESDYLAIESLVGTYDRIATTSHVLAETSNLLRQVGNPVRDLAQQELRRLILACDERPIESAVASGHEQYLPLGLTDAAVLTACALSSRADDRIDLLTADEPIYLRAASLGLRADLYA